MNENEEPQENPYAHVPDETCPQCEQPWCEEHDTHWSNCACEGNRDLEHIDPDEDAKCDWDGDYDGAPIGDELPPVGPPSFDQMYEMKMIKRGYKSRG